MELFTSHFQAVGGLASNHQIRDQIKGLGETAPCGNGFSGSDENPPGHHIGIRKIACLGSGFVGGPTSAVTAFKSNVKVTVVDINPDRIAAWKSMNLPIYEPGLEPLVFAARDGVNISVNSSSSGMGSNSGQFTRRPSLFFSTDVNKAIEEADLIFVCVNTPTKAHGIGKGAGADLSFVEAATRSIARVAKRSKIVVEKSTVPCRTAESIRQILSANAHPGVVFDVLSNPEFLAEGTAVRDLLYPDRIIIGSMPTPSGHRAAALLAEVYAQWVPEDRIITMNLWSAELSKLAANAMLAQRISSVNALSAICETTGANVDEVSHACGLDSRIGPGMLKAGPGFGGSCFQKDIFNIVYLSESLHLYEVADYWRAIMNMNEYQKQRFTKRIIACLFNNLAGKKIAVLGFAFKKNTSDTRESPAITLVSNFIAEKAKVAIYDPKVKEEQIWTDLVNDGGDINDLRANLEICSSAYVACNKADAVVVVTEWQEFSNKTQPKAPKYTGSAAVLREKTQNYTLKARPPAAPKHTKSQSTSVLPHSFQVIDTYGQESAASLDKQLAELMLVADREQKPPLDWGRIADSMRKPRFVFDGRGILDTDKLEKLGFQVEAIGRASSAPQHALVHG
ncbi:UDP-glucose 6-dehydrogenase 1 [Trapelia coarctata]|nr:UDP-glucose 6-dehydrogenase 1 [Trapelia coarctata]